MADLLEINDLTVEFSVHGGHRLVLDQVSLDLAPGEALGLVGESGSGKSTMARAVVRGLPGGAQVRGNLRFKGADISAMGPKELRAFRAQSVATIGQNPRASMNPVRRIGDFATEALRTNFKVPPAEALRRAAVVLGDIGINAPERVLRQYPHQLSGGMLQRVVIAAALLIEPDLIIADEPTTALDVTTQSEVMAILQSMRAERGMAMLFITHDLDLAAAVCDRTAVLYAGQIIEEQASSQLQSTPQHPYTSGLVSARPRVDVDIERLVTIPGRPLAAYERGAGCTFAPRCEYATDKCRESMPPGLVTTAGRVACWHAEELGTLLHNHEGESIGS